MPYFQHQGIQFHYEDGQNGLPFFFQHGLGAHSGQPLSLFQPPAGFRVICMDARAHGETHPPGRPEDLSFNTLADDLRALMDHLEIRQAIVGGISMGAGIALNFALRFPDRILGLVLSRPAWLEFPCPWNVTMQSLITRILRDCGAERGLAVFQETPEYQDTLARWPYVARTMISQFQDPQAERTAFRYERIVQDCPNRDRRAWASIGVPALVLANRDDPVHPFEYGEALARAIPGATLRELTSKAVSFERHGADVQRELETFLLEHFGAPSQPLSHP